MKLRMYLRGLGLGIMVSALVLLFGVKKQDGAMTDAEIRARAIELGMVDESTTLADAGKTEEPEVVEEPEAAEEPEVATEPEVVEEPEVAEEPEEPAKSETADTTEPEKKEETVKPEDSKKPEDNKKQEDTKDTTEPAKDTTDTKKDEVPEDIKTSTKEYKLTIQGGYSSDRVAKILESAGVIDSAADFDKYLCDKGYDHRISTGTYTIPTGADYETIAGLITHTR